jgi:hypothetical protein
MLSEIRIGKFTSSQAVKLVSKGKGDPFGKPFYTYVKSRRQERNAGRALDGGSGGRATVWGSFVENWLMFKRPDIIGMEYTLTPQRTDVHPTIADWCGSRDGFNNDTGAVIDIKCPYTMQSFCDFADCKNIDEVRAEHTDGDKYYWQLVSNACIAGVDKAELIIFCPNEEQLQGIQEYAVMGTHDFGNDVYFIGNGDVSELPYLPVTAKYSNVLRFAFDVPQADKDFLTERVQAAVKLV